MSRQLFRRTTLVSANTFFSRILGFVRDIVVGHYLGASVGADAFFISFRIPNFMRALFAEGAFSQAFIPVLAKYRQTKSHEDTRVFIDRVTGDLAAVLTIVAVLGVIFASFVITIFAPGFLKDPVRFVLATHMLRVMFPYVLLISVTALCSGLLNTYDSFGVPAFTPVLLNIILIVMAIFAASHFAPPIYALAWGVLIAGVAQVLFQLPFLFHKRVLPRLSISFKDPGVRRVLKLMAPAIVGVSVVQLSLLLDTLFASFLPVGSVSWLYYSSRLMNFPLGVFGVAIATVILPKLARQHNAKDHASFSGTLDWGLRVLLLIAVPSTVGLWILSGPLLATLFKTGRFDVNDVLMTQQSLIAFSSGIAAFMLIKVLASAFYAKQDIATPVRIAVAAVTLKIILNLILIFPLKHVGLALSTSLSAFFNVALLLIFLLRRKLYQPQSGWGVYFLRLVIANMLMGLFLFFVKGNMSVWFSHERFWRIEYLTILLLGAVIIYFGSLFGAGSRLRL